MPMKLDEIAGAKTFKLIDANGVQSGEVSIRPQGKWPTQVEISTWRAGRYKNVQKVIVDGSIIAAILSELDGAKA